MKLDATLLRYLGKEDFRALTAIEQGMKNHELVPLVLIESIAKLKRGGLKQAISTIHKHKLVWHDSKNYHGYKLTYLGYDYLALKALTSRGSISAIGRQIGVGKESDIFVAVNDQGEEMALKLHRLGRVSFRNIKQKRDYIQHRKSPSWIYLSRLAALKEYAFMKALYDHGFPVPKPVDCNRHCVLMSLCDGCLLAQVKELKHPGKVYTDLMNLVIRLAQHGLIHCDFNEFNIMINDKEEITLIDFPQMVSTSHVNAEMYFDRDVACIRTFFSKRFGFEAESWPKFKVDTEKQVNLDVAVAASGFTSQDQEQLEQFAAENQKLKDNAKDNSNENIDSDDDEEEEDEDDDEEKGEEEFEEDGAEEEEEDEEEEPTTKSKHEETVGNKEKDLHSIATEESKTKTETATAEEEDTTPQGIEDFSDEQRIRLRVAKEYSKRSKQKIKRNTAKSRTKKEHADIVKSFS